MATCPLSRGLYNKGLVTSGCTGANYSFSSYTMRFFDMAVLTGVLYMLAVTYIFFMSRR